MKTVKNLSIIVVTFLNRELISNDMKKYVILCLDNNYTALKQTDLSKY